MRTRLARVLADFCLLGVVLNAAAFAYAYLIHPRLALSKVADPSLDWFAFMTRTFTFHAGVFLLVVTAACLLARAHRTGWVALVLAVVLLAPTLWDARPKSGEAAGDALTIATFNLWASNTDYDAAIDTILNTDADVLCLQEYTPQWHERCEPALIERYPFRITDPRADYFGSAIYSRLPVDENGFHMMNILGTNDSPVSTVWLMVGGRRVGIWNVHLRHQGYGQSEEVDGLTRLLNAGWQPDIIIGDFNFTQYSAEHASFTNAGYRDAFDLAGSGLNTTWPNHRAAAVAFYPGFRIDHIYLSPDLTATHLRVAPTPGSDHSHVVTTIGFTTDLDGLSPSPAPN